MQRVKSFVKITGLMAVLALHGGCDIFGKPHIDTVEAGCWNYPGVNGVQFDCTAMDPCTETDEAKLLSCCDCDPGLYCRSQPSCSTLPDNGPAESCMTCHNGATSRNDYSGDGLNNPHNTTGGASFILCTDCHGGDGSQADKDRAHVPRPPEIPDELQIANDPEAYFNYLTHAGIDRFDDYMADGTVFTPVQYLQFINPGDLRVVAEGRGCGASACHGDEHGIWVPRSLMATEAGIYSGALFASGVPNANPLMQDWYGDTAAEYGFRVVSDPDFVYDPADVGVVGELFEFPEQAQFQAGQIFNNPAYDANVLDTQVYAVSAGDENANAIIPNTPLADLVHEIIAISCGNCHLGSRGANNRFGDFRSAGCTACHMQYQPNGRSLSRDPNVASDEPVNPDAIRAPEDSHPAAHVLSSVAKVLPGGGVQRGIKDLACAGCHGGSNRTVLQYWGVRLDRNEDVVNNFQYPANPNVFQNTANNRQLFELASQNATFNGRNPNQLLDFEDYDADGLDDIPGDVHWQAGMGCIDCHGSRDVHNGSAGDPTSGRILSRESQAVAIECESCHGGVDERAAVGPCVDYQGTAATCALDRNGNPLRNTRIDADNQYFLRSRVTGQTHYIPQTFDTVRPNGVRNPQTNQLVFTPEASYAMGRADGDNAGTGLGPLQADPNLVTPGFTHLATGQATDGNVECATCHASWTNNCVGCHLAPGYDANPQNFFFSNTTGERIALYEAAADLVYSNPIPFQLGVGTRDRISLSAPGMTTFFRYDGDLNGNTSSVFAFTDRRGHGNNPGVDGRGNFGALAHNKIAPHSQRGARDANNEGVRSCQACHLNTSMLDNYGPEYGAFRAALQNGDHGNLDFALLQVQIGQNTGNELNSPFFVHMAAGLGSGLFLFDADGCPVNPLDANANRFYCQGVSPADRFDPASVAFDLDRVVEETGVENASSGHPLAGGAVSSDRDGALAPDLAGPLGQALLRRLTDPNGGLVLDSWVDTNGDAQGNAGDFL